MGWRERVADSGFLDTATTNRRSCRHQVIQKENYDEQATNRIY
ncbi:hypothetical protein LRHK_781 [Lacticaseibacillus rhamnosus ATCC 8530]|nr:hypothetical protein LRHK_781 [Lacticaseibacillus rhamnosus ATCC 8530]